MTTLACCPIPGCVSAAHVDGLCFAHGDRDPATIIVHTPPVAAWCRPHVGRPHCGRCAWCQIDGIPARTPSRVPAPVSRGTAPDVVEDELLLDVGEAR